MVETVSKVGAHSPAQSLHKQGLSCETRPAARKEGRGRPTRGGKEKKSIASAAATHPRRREPLRHRRGRQRRLRRPLLRRHRRPARPRIPNLSALKNHFGAAAAGSDDFGGLFSADQLALEFPTCNHFHGFQKATKEMVKNKKGTTTLLLHLRQGVIVSADSRASMDL
ncbi:uncharacterized protein LOC125547140 [Triticum urartu]|uniref:uncharacterized protein LOC125547140 n=1 Tax=Triticum urartu TaxID=4572 RepID=UPI002044A5C3|nr:uncharacterized protein LOC125547140 [Triticum urartu]